MSVTVSGVSRTLSPNPARRNGSCMSIPRLKSYLSIVATLLVLGQAVPAQAVELPDFTQLVEQASPAVVNISTTQKLPERKVSDQQMPDLAGLPPMLREFFERGMPQQRAPRGGGGGQREAQSLGSGFIISPDGYILTNNHVIADADEILVRLADRSELKAKLVGTDPRSDVALLKIEGKDLSALKLGKSQDLKAGQWVVAIGSPFGFDHTVTQGIVSAVGRSLPNENYVPFIQTDVAINPGNSGGPLFNLNGEVVGINSQIYTRSGGFMGLSFAIPIDVAIDVSNQLKSAGKVTRGWLGIGIQEITKDLADSFGMKNTNGALVSNVEKSSPAEKGGLEAGDVIVKFDGKPIMTSSDLPRAVGATKPGKQVQVEILRKSASRTLNISVGEMPTDKDEVATTPKGPAKPEVNRIGLVLKELTPQQKKKLNGKNGLLVVEAQGSAAQAGIRRGDVIPGLNK